MQQPVFNCYLTEIKSCGGVRGAYHFKLLIEGDEWKTIYLKFVPNNPTYYIRNFVKNDKQYDEAFIIALEGILHEAIRFHSASPAVLKKSLLSALTLASESVQITMPDHLKAELYEDIQDLIDELPQMKKDINNNKFWSNSETGNYFVRESKKVMTERELLKHLNKYPQSVQLFKAPENATGDYIGFGEKIQFVKIEEAKGTLIHT